MKAPENLIFVFLTALLLVTSSVSAKIWRVNNRVGIVADFTTAQAAHDGANAGDTVFFEPSPTNYGDITLTKKLILIGTGYFLDQNLETQWKNNWPATIGHVTFSSNSSSSAQFSQLM